VEAHRYQACLDLAGKEWAVVEWVVRQEIMVHLAMAVGEVTKQDSIMAAEAVGLQ
jgi:hypothetical protein